MGACLQVPGSLASPTEVKNRPGCRLRVTHHTGRHGQSIVSPELDQQRMAHGDAGHVIGGHRALIVGQRVGGHTVGVV
jgi:hypothetical protein